MAFLTAADVIVNASGAASNDSGLFDSGVTGSDRLLLVVVLHEEGSDPAVSAITYGGVSLTKEVEVESSDTSGFAESLEIWYLANPATGSNTVQLTNSATDQDFGVFAAVYTGRDQTTPVLSANNVTMDRVNNDDGTMTITKPATDDDVFWTINQDRGSDKVWSLETDNNSRLEQQFGGSGTGCYIILGDMLVGSGAVSVGATQTAATIEGPHDMIGLAIVLQPASSGVSGSGSPQAATATVDGSGQVTPVHTGSGTPSAQQATVTGVAERTVTGSGTPSAQQVILAADVVISSALTGTGTLAAGSASLEATGLAYSTASGALQAGSAALDGEGAIIRALRTADGELQAQSAEIAAQILRTVMGSGTMGANAATADVYPWIELHTQDSEWEEQLADWGKDL